MTTVTVEITLPIANVPNSNGRHHWSVTARRRAAMRKLAGQAAHNIGPIDTPCRVEFQLIWPDRRRRDSWNFETKGFLDALVDAGIIPDDNDRIVRSVNTTSTIQRQPNCKTVTIRATVTTMKGQQ